MSFIKVTDPRKREALIKDFIETRKRIKDNFVAKKVGEIEYQTGLTKLFKPITETQKATAKEITEAQKATAEKITSELLPIKEGIERLPAVTFPAYPAVEMLDENLIKLGPIATNALKSLGSKDEVDRNNGLVTHQGEFYIGNKPIEVKDNNIIIEDKIYKGTSGLWKLIMSNNIPDKSEYKAQDLANYAFIMKQTGTTYVNNNPTLQKKGGSNKKMNEIIKPLVREIEEGTEKSFNKKISEYFGFEEDEETEDEDEDPQPSTSGTGLTVLPSNPNAVIDRFDLLFTSQKAGHTGVRNEIISILDELKRQGVININEYKKLNSIIKK